MVGWVDVWMVDASSPSFFFCASCFLLSIAVYLDGELRWERIQIQTDTGEDLFRVTDLGYTRNDQRS